MITSPNSLKKRALLVTSSYMPVTIADMHRVRHLAWELPKLGWDVEVLAPNIEFQRTEYVEPESVPLFNPEVPYHEVPPDDLRIFSLLNMRSIGWRALRPLARAGDSLLGRRKYDLVYLSTANFNLFCLGRWWARKHKAPYVLDYHDPWVQQNIDYTTTPNRLKRRVSAALSMWMERYALAGAAGIISVSPVYLDEMRQRYGSYRCLRADRTLVIPFSGSDVDFRTVGEEGEKRETDEIEIIYTGAGGSIMAKSFTMICETLAEVRRREPALLDRLKIRLFGTFAYWKIGDPKPLLEIASQFGLGDIVEEIPPRITYMKSMELLKGSDGLLILGVDDHAYVPSKLFTYGLSGKPILACFRYDSPSVQVFRKLSGMGSLLTFGGNNLPAADAAISEMREFLNMARRRARVDRRLLIKDYLAPRMAEKHAALFEHVSSVGMAT